MRISDMNYRERSTSIHDPNLVSKFRENRFVGSTFFLDIVTVLIQYFVQ